MRKAIIYIDGDDIRRFREGGSALEPAFAYEWEDENVVHVHISPLQHSFGLSKTAIFVESLDCDEKSGYDFIVQVSAANVLVYEHLDYEELIQQEVAIIPSKEDLYSRNKGILELGILENKRVMIVGLGSFGSQIAIELAKAGVGNFGLFDFDRVELHNLARHTCVLNDLGRLKTDAIRDAILGKNPYATVDRFPVDINEDYEFLVEQVSKSDLVICATDNNQSRFNISKALVECGKTGLFGRAITRAEGGDVFRYRPGGPCYVCLVGASFLPQEEIADEVSARRTGAIPAYANAQEADAVVQVGLSSDIQPICNLMIKLALCELSIGMQSGISSLYDDFVYDCYIWANRREKHYKNWHTFFKAGSDRTVMRWYGINVPKDDSCAICSHQVVLDSDQEGRFHDSNMDFSGLSLEE